MKVQEDITKNISYVPIQDPVSFRRHIILTSIDVIKILEKYERLTQIRNEKKKVMSQLKGKLSDLKENVSSLKDGLPSLNKPELKRESKQVEKKMDTVKYSKGSKGYKHLQHELNELQDRLEKLNI